MACPTHNATSVCRSFCGALGVRCRRVRSRAPAGIRNHLKFTEDNVQKKVGEGSWQTVSKLRAFRQDILDVRQSTAASLVVLEEESSPALFALRLKISDSKINAIQTPSKAHEP